MKLDVKKIEKLRSEKILSLFVNHVDDTVLSLRKSLKLIGCRKKEDEKIEKSLQFALNQVYGDSTLSKYYICHPLRVAVLCTDWMIRYKDVNTDLIVAAIIHNFIEKNVLNFEQIEDSYGRWVAETLRTITVNREEEKQAGWAKNYYEELYKLDKYGQILKAFDKFDNIYALCINPNNDIRAKYIAEIEKYIKPVIAAFAPDYIDYFNELLFSTNSIGYKPKEYFMNNSS